MRFNISPKRSIVMVDFSLGRLWNWEKDQPQDNCTFLKLTNTDGVVHAQCDRRIYFACIQGKAVLVSIGIKGS